MQDVFEEMKQMGIACNTVSYNTTPNYDLYQAVTGDDDLAATRHNKAINDLFVDGHVASLPKIDPDSLVAKKP